MPKPNFFNSFDKTISLFLAFVSSFLLSVVLTIVSAFMLFSIPSSYALNLDSLTNAEKKYVYERIKIIQKQQGIDIFKQQQKEQALKRIKIKNLIESRVKKPSNHKSELQIKKERLNRQTPEKKQKIKNKPIIIKNKTIQTIDLTKPTKKKTEIKNNQALSDNRVKNSTNLKQLIELIFSKSEYIGIAKEKKIQTNLNATTLNSTFLPNISASVNTNKTETSSNRFNSSVRTDSVGINLSETIWQPFSNDISAQKAKITQKLAKYIFEQTESDLIQKSATAFFNVLKANYQIDFAKATFKGAEDTLKTAKILFETGQTSKLELLRSQGSFAVAKAELLSSNQTYAKSLIVLGNLVGLDIKDISDAGISKLENIAAGFIQSPDNPWLNQMGANNTQLKIAFIKEKLAGLGVINAKKKYAPKLQLKANLTQFFNNANSNNGSSIGLSFSVPLYQAGNFNTKLKTSNSLLTESQLNYDLLKKQLRYQLVNLEQKQKYLNQIVNAYDKARQSLKDQLEKTIEAYKLGVTQVNDVNNATTNYAKAELRYKLAKIDKLINFIAIQQLLGYLSKQKVMSLI